MFSIRLNTYFILKHHIIIVFCRGGRYTEEDAKAIVIQILSVVSFCHFQGVVHRDLKPEVCILNSIECK